MIEKQELEGVIIVLSDLKHGCCEIREGVACHCQNSVIMMKIVEKLLEHDDSLNKCIKEKNFNTRARAREHMLGKRFETAEPNEGNEKIKKNQGLNQ